MPYFDGGAEVGGDFPAVALDAGPDVTRNPDELQVCSSPAARGVVDAVDPGLRGQRGWAPEGWARGTPRRAS